jgi:hypothetical protein
LFTRKVQGKYPLHLEDKNGLVYPSIGLVGLG